MKKEKKIKLFLGSSYLLIVFVFLWFFFSNFSIQDFTSFELIKEKLSAMKIKYLIKITGETKTNASSGALSCAAGPGGGGCFGFAWWDDTSAYNASVWDLSQETSVGNVSANVTGTSMIPAIIIPIPILARTQSNACAGLSDQIVNFFSG